MKRKDLIRMLEAMGCKLKRHGGNHDWYVNEETQQSQPVPRHNEIDDYLAKAIIKKLAKPD
jgi:mRNA interferase HicA